MTLWQGVPEELGFLREEFERKKLWKFVSDLGAIATLGVVAIVLVAKAVIAPEFASIAAAAFFAPYSLAHAWAALRRIRTRRAALPLSGKEYLATVDHNLAIEERALLWEQRTLPFALVCGGAIIAWLIATGWARLSPQTIAFALVVATGCFGFGSWWTYARKPAKLTTERRALADLQRELERT